MIPNSFFKEVIDLGDGRGNLLSETGKLAKSKLTCPGDSVVQFREEIMLLMYSTVSLYTKTIADVDFLPLTVEVIT